MKLGRLLSGVLAVGSLVSAQGQTPACANNPADKPAVVEAMRSLYKAAMASDLAGFDAMLAQGFYAYDSGQRLDGDSVMKLVMRLQAKGEVYVWTVQDADVHVFCDHAWIAYVNRGSYKATANAPVVPVTWLESADLERIGGKWKLVFFQSFVQKPLNEDAVPAKPAGS